MSTLIAIGLPMNVFSAVLIGHRRFDLNNVNEIGSRLIAAILTYIAMRSGGTLLSLCMIQVVARIQAWTVTLIFTRRVAGHLGVHPSHFRWPRVRELWGYGFRNFVGNIALLIIYRIDLTVVGAFIGVPWVTFYSLGAALPNYASAAISTITYVFTPQFARLHAKGDEPGLIKSFFSGMRISGIAATTLSAGILIFGRSFLSLWVGTKYVTGAWAYRSDVIMMLLVVAQLPRFMQSISWQLLFGTGRTRFLMWMNVCEAIANLVLSIVLGRRFGPAGVALGTLIPAMISHIVALPAYVLRTFHFRALTYIGEGMGRAVAVGAGVALTGQALISLRPPTTWAVLASEVALSAVVGLCLSISIGITGDERSSLIHKLRGPRAP
jgi:O-antigen/teichoic acid export membrane protein